MFAAQQLLELGICAWFLRACGVSIQNMACFDASHERQNHIGHHIWKRAYIQARLKCLWLSWRCLKATQDCNCYDLLNIGIWEFDVSGQAQSFLRLPSDALRWE